MSTSKKVSLLVLFGLGLAALICFSVVMSAVQAIPFFLLSGWGIGLVGFAVGCSITFGLMSSPSAAQNVQSAVKGGIGAVRDLFSLYIKTWRQHWTNLRAPEPPKSEPQAPVRLVQDEEKAA